MGGRFRAAIRIVLFSRKPQAESKPYIVHTDHQLQLYGCPIRIRRPADVSAKKSAETPKQETVRNQACADAHIWQRKNRGRRTAMFETSAIYFFALLTVLALIYLISDRSLITLVVTLRPVELS